MNIGLKGMTRRSQGLRAKKKAKVVQPPVWKGYRKTKSIEDSLDRAFEKK